jgi:hypothetical protein
MQSRLAFSERCDACEAGIGLAAGGEALRLDFRSWTKVRDSGPLPSVVGRYSLQLSRYRKIGRHQSAFIVNHSITKILKYELLAIA